MGIYRQRASHSEGIGRSHRDWIYLEIFLIFAYCLRSPVCSKKFAFEADVTFPTTGQKIIEWAFVEILHFKIMTYPRINALNISSDRALRRRIVRLRSLLCDTKWEVFCEGFMFISNRWCKVKSIVLLTQVWHLLHSIFCFTSHCLPPAWRRNSVTKSHLLWIVHSRSLGELLWFILYFNPHFLALLVQWELYVNCYIMWL